jgi:hypothetical protein
MSDGPAALVTAALDVIVEKRGSGFAKVRQMIFGKSGIGA